MKDIHRLLLDQFISISALNYFNNKGPVLDVLYSPSAQDDLDLHITDFSQDCLAPNSALLGRPDQGY